MSHSFHIIDIILDAKAARFKEGICWSSNVVNSKAILIISGILVIVGILISFSQSEMEMSDIATTQQTLPVSGVMNVTKSLDPMKSEDGVYSIQISDFKDGDSLNADITDPSGNHIVTKSITKSPIQENFTISSTGTYELKIENTARNELQVLAIIGYYPQGATFLDVFSVIILIAGLSGLAIGMMYFIKKSRKNKC